MKVRDCENCKHHTSDGCSKWDCEFEAKDLINRADAIKAIKKEIQDFEANYMHSEDEEEYGHDIGFVAGLHTAKTFIRSLPSAEATKKKAELKENGDWDCPDVFCDECDHHRSVEWCSLAIPNHEEIDETYKMVNEAFFEGFDVAEKRYRFLIETVEKLDKKSAEAEWIPVSERLPMMGDYVLTYRPTMGMRMLVDSYEGYYGEDDDEWYEGWVYGGDKVVAWMPLPMPYREDGEV